MDSLVIKEIRNFINKTYQRDLWRGLLSVVLLSLVFILVFTGIESYYWLDPKSKRLIWWAYGLLASVLAAWYVVRPVVFWLRVRKGISWKQAASMIGERNPRLGEKLKVYIELWEERGGNEMARAGMNLKGQELGGVRLGGFVDRKIVLRLAGLLSLPIIVFLAWFALGGLESFIEPYKRVMRADMAFNRPATYKLEFNARQEFEEGEPTVLVAELTGSVLPLELYVRYGEQLILMQKKDNLYLATLSFSGDAALVGFTDGEFSFGPYQLNRRRNPEISTVEAIIKPPAYTRVEAYAGDPNGLEYVPQGSRVTWRIETRDADTVWLVANGQPVEIQVLDNQYRADDRVMKGYEYALYARNKARDQQEALRFKWTVLRDASPRIRLREESLSGTDIFRNTALFSDDYGVRRVEVVVRRGGNWEVLESFSGKGVNSGELPLNQVEPLLREFSGEWALRVWDNDQVNGSKSSMSSVFFQKDSRREIVKSIDEIEEKLLDRRKGPEPDRIFYNQDNGSSYELTNQQKEKLREWLKQESDARKSIDDITRELGKRNLNEEFRKRLEREMEQNSQLDKMLEEFEKNIDSLGKNRAEEIKKEIEKRASLQQKNLMQILELSKKFEVRQLVNWLRQELNSEIDSLARFENSPDIGLGRMTQQRERLAIISRQAVLLIELNDNLKRPIEFGNFGTNINRAVGIQEARAGLLGNSSLRDQLKEKTRIEKVELQLARDKLGNAMEASGAQQLQEDLNMLRQSLDNLLQVSNEQESLFVQDKSYSKASFALISDLLKKQRNLKELFQHVDDSVFAVALRNDQIGKDILEEIEEVHYQMDLSMTSLADGITYRAENAQQRALNSQNKLSSMLAEVLDNLELNPEGKGSGSDFQLEDIIQKQKGITEALRRRQNTEGAGEEKPGDSKRGERNAASKGAETEGNGKSDEGKGKNEDDPQGKGGQDSKGSSSEGEGKGQDSEGSGQTEKGEGKDGQSGQGQEGNRENAGQEGNRENAGQEGNRENAGQEGQKGKPQGEGGKSEGQKGKSDGQAGQSGESGQGGSTGDNTRLDDRSKGRAGDRQPGDGGKEGESDDNNGALGDNNEESKGDSGYQDTGLSREELFDIYKQQEEIRQRLEDQLEDLQLEEGAEGAQELLRDIENLQRDLLREDGLQNADEKALNIEQELLKLREAVNTKGMEEKRESRSNADLFPPVEGYLPVRTRPETREILNRGEVPLNIRNKVRARKYLGNGGSDQ